MRPGHPTSPQPRLGEFLATDKNRTRLENVHSCFGLNFSVFGGVRTRCLQGSPMSETEPRFTLKPMKDCQDLVLFLFCFVLSTRLICSVRLKTHQMHPESRLAEAAVPTKTSQSQLLELIDWLPDEPTNSEQRNGPLELDGSGGNGCLSGAWVVLTQCSLIEQGPDKSASVFCPALFKFNVNPLFGSFALLNDRANLTQCFMNAE